MLLQIKIIDLFHRLILAIQVIQGAQCGIPTFGELILGTLDRLKPHVRVTGVRNVRILTAHFVGWSSSFGLVSDRECQ